MEKSEITKKKPRRCIKCNEPLNNFIAYVPDEGEEFLKCYTEYAKSKGSTQDTSRER